MKQRQRAEWENYTRRSEDSVIRDLFGGRFYFESRCSQCFHVVKGFENFLSVFVHPKQVIDSISLNQMIKNLENEDSVKGSLCPNCNVSWRFSEENLLWQFASNSLHCHQAIPRVPRIFSKKQCEGDNSSHSSNDGLRWAFCVRCWKAKVRAFGHFEPLRNLWFRTLHFVGLFCYLFIWKQWLQGDCRGLYKMDELQWSICHGMLLKQASTAKHNGLRPVLL